jgi:S-adenosylmethionine-diacylglycerol 3-amino-3-carboxypropyl transferase
MLEKGRGFVKAVFAFFYSFFAWLLDKVVARCYLNKIVFNCAWEDPRLDLEALNLSQDDNILIITTAGCNVLSLALNEPNHIYSIDRNICQNSLLELKLAAIREFDYATFWKLFGTGRLANFSKVHYPRLRQHLTPAARTFWDKHAHYFDGKGLRPSFYWRGCSGILAWIICGYIRVLGLTGPIKQLLDAQSIEEQERIYKTKIEGRLWNPLIMWFFGSSAALALLNGVPEAQRELLEKEGGSKTIGHFIKEQMEVVFCKLPIKDNYFYRVYLTGQYTKDCCPDYLTEEGFNKLKAGAADKISIHTTTITEFLESHKKKDITRYVLLDHMDWMAASPKALSEEWEAMIDHAADTGARFLWRSASVEASYVGETKVTRHVTGGDGQVTTVVPVKSLLDYDYTLAAKLHPLDRVHTYASFFIADLNTAKAH